MVKQPAFIVQAVKSATLTLILFSMHLICTSQQMPDRASLADRYFKNHDFAKAIPLYNSLVLKKEKAIYVSRLAESYRQVRDFKNAERWFEKQLILSPTTDLPRLYYAEALQENGKPLKAASELLHYIPQDENHSRIKALLSASCKYAIEISGKRPVYRIRNETTLNTVYSEFSADFNQANLIFVSNRPLPANPGSKDNGKLYGWTNKPFWKLLITRPDSLGPVKNIELLSPAINSVYNNGPAVLNKTGDIIYFSKAEFPDTPEYKSKAQAAGKMNHNGIYVSHHTNGNWQAAVSLPINDVKHFSVSHPALSPDGKLLIFASDIAGGRGGVDLYSAEILSDGNLGPVVNLGDQINSAGDEMFPVFGPDSSLYFSSTGWLGLGGLDIFKSEFVAGKWSKPENVGAPINSCSDDFSMIFKPGLPNRGYFSSNRDGGKGDDDIYYFEALKDSISQLNNVKLARIAAIDTVKSFFKISSLEHLEGKMLALPQIHYRINKADLDSAAIKIVYHVFQLLEIDPLMRIQINSHADITGTVKGNMILSRKRANTIRLFLLAKGIASNRITTRGYGDHRPFIPCGFGRHCSIEQNRLNRRTELLILKN